MISLEGLQLLDAIDVRGSFAAAAEALFRVPSAVTHAVRKLETDLGVALFARDGRRAVMTPAGRALLEEGRHLLAAAGQLERRVQRIATGWESELTVAVDAVVEIATLLPLVAEFGTTSGGTRLRFTCEVLGGGWDALWTGRADLAVAIPGDPPPGGGWTTRPFGSVDFVFAVAPGHPLAQAREPLGIGDLAGHRVVIMPDTSRELLARTAGLAATADALTVPDAASKTAAIVAGLGIGHLPRRTAEAEAAAGRLVVKRLAGGILPSPRYLAWRGGREGRALEWFVERLDTPAWRERLLGTGTRATRARPRRP